MKMEQEYHLPPGAEPVGGQPICGPSRSSASVIRYA